MKLSTIVRGLTIASLLSVAPISAPVSAFAVDSMDVGDVDLTSARAKIDKQDYAAAVTELRGLAEDTPNADVYNLLGFSLRKTGDFDTALSYYTKALELQPDHKGAHEYLGELYLETNQPAKAQQQLAELTRLCPTGCEELEDLQKAIAAKTAG